MTNEELQVIKERVAKATVGPWEWRNDCYDDFWLASNHFIVADSFGYDDGDSTIRVSEADAEFIAHARQDVPTLVAEVERLREALLLIQNSDTWLIEPSPMMHTIEEAYHACVGIADKALGVRKNDNSTLQIHKSRNR